MVWKIAKARPKKKRVINNDPVKGRFMASIRAASEVASGVSWKRSILPLVWDDAGRSRCAGFRACADTPQTPVPSTPSPDR